MTTGLKYQTSSLDYFPPPVLLQLFSSGPHRLKETKFMLPVAEALGKNKAKSAEMTAKTLKMPRTDDMNDTERHQDEKGGTTAEVVVKDEAKVEVEKKKEEEGLTGTGQTSRLSGSIQLRFVQLCRHLKTLKQEKKRVGIPKKKELNRENIAQPQPMTMKNISGFDFTERSCEIKVVHHPAGRVLTLQKLKLRRLWTERGGRQEEALQRKHQSIMGKQGKVTLHFIAESPFDFLTC